MKTINIIRQSKRAVKNFSFFILLFSFALALASCSKEAAEELAPQTETTTFTLSVDELQTPAQAKVATRATSTVTPARYVMEVWSEDGTTAENVFDNNTTNHKEVTTGSITVTLDKTKAYTCLFWADGDTDNTGGTFNAAALKTISLNTGKDITEAYHAKVAVPKGKNLAVAVTLGRAVAKVVLTETAAVETSKDIALKFSNIYPQFNVLDGAASGTPAEWTKTVKPAATTGTIGTFYFFAKPVQELTEMKFTYAAEAEKTVSNVPYQMNYATNIKGEYSSLGSFTFTVTADDEWYTPDNEVDFGTKLYKVGDVYPDAAAPIGVVFWVDETDPSYNSTDKTSAKGKIVGLTEGTGLAWSTEQFETGATNTTDGRANMATIAQYITDNSKSWGAYPAFKWVAEQNGKATGGWDAATDKWYLPAKEELKALYGEYNGENPNNDNVKVAVNTSLAAISGAAKLASAYYWASTENVSTHSWYVYFTSGYTASNDKTRTNSRTRCVREF